jgi:hypothetical protein
MQRHRAEARGFDPGGERARYADSHPARHPLREERDRLPCRRVDERVRREPLRRRLTAVDGDHPVLAGEVDDHEAAYADAGDQRLGHAEHGVGRDRGIDRVAALTEDLDAGTCRVGIDRGDCAAGPDGNRFLGWLGCSRGADGSPDEHRGEREQREKPAGQSEPHRLDCCSCALQTRR